MKKILLFKVWDSYALKKIFRIMRISFVLLLIGIANVYAKPSYAQKAKVSLDLTDRSVAQILEEIETKSEFFFLYNSKLVDVNRKLSIHVDKEAIGSVLSDIFQGTNTAFEVMDNKIILAPKSLNQSSIIIKGVVKDAKGEPVPGVSVVVKGTTTGTITDIDGAYSLKDVPSDGIVVFSFIGMKKKEVQVKGTTVINVTLEEESIGIDEVIAVGYGMQSKRNITGAVQNIDDAELKDLPTMQVTQKLQGKVSGVQINQTTGKLGTGLTVRVRGAASLTASSDPLYVVDGMPVMSDDVADINPDEIENISILKDASSCALYGSRGANGVVMITTKKAKQGQSSVSFNMYTGFQEVPKKGRPDMMNAREFATFKKEIAEENDETVDEMFENPDEYGEGTDWYDVVTRNAPIQNYSFSFSSSKDKFSSSLVASYFTQDGVVVNTDYQRYSIRLNSEYKFNDWIKVGANVSNTHYDKNGPETDGLWYNTEGIIQGACLTSPLAPVYDDDGNVTTDCSGYGNTISTPNFYFNALNTVNKSKKTGLLGNGYIEIEPIKGLKYKSSIGIDLMNYSNRTFTPSTVGSFYSTGHETNYDYTSGSYGTSYAVSWLWENTLNYTKEFNGHHFDALLGYSAQHYKEETSSMSGSGYPDNEVQALSAATTITGSTANSAWALLSEFARLNYNYKKRYIASVAIRRDGSSRFGSDNRWGSFPSASVGWAFTEENFMQNLNTPISFGKLRVSYGVTGNNNIGNYTQYADMTDTNTAINSVITNGKSLAGLNNTELGWETTTELDLGFDIGFFNDRIFFSYDYYKRRTDDMLYTVDIPISSGFYSYTTNIGCIDFWGHELSLTTKNIKTPNLEWSTTFNIAFARNKAVNVGTAAGYIDGDYTRTYEGQEIGQLYGMHWLGVAMDEETYENNPKYSGEEVGCAYYEDVDGSGDVTFTSADKKCLGNSIPRATYGISTTLRYKNLDFSATGSGAQSFYIFNVNDRFYGNLDGTFNVYKSLANRWKSLDDPGDGHWGKADTNTSGYERDNISSLHMHKGNYFTLKNITAGYRFNFKNIPVIKSLRVYGSVQQVYVFTKYPGNNPEVSAAAGLNSGYDESTYPVPRTYTFGINANF